MLECGPEKDCHPATCCEVKQKNIIDTQAIFVPPQNPVKNMDDNTQELQSVTVLPNRGAVADDVTSPALVTVTVKDEGITPLLTSSHSANSWAAATSSAINIDLA